jgi:hypothetical protein
MNLYNEHWPLARSVRLFCRISRAEFSSREQMCCRVGSTNTPFLEEPR